MRLDYLETNIIAAYLMDAWQNHLGTEHDPTSGGKWIKHGPEGTPGLLGGLSDVLVSNLEFLPDRGVLSRTKEVALSTLLDNRNGLMDDLPAVSTLSWEIANSSTTAQEYTNSVRSSLTATYSASVSFGTIATVAQEYSIGLEYSYSWTKRHEVVKTDTKSFVVEVPIKVPTGKAYKLIVMADRAALNIPYKANIRLKGRCDANFETPVGGQKQWRAPAGTMCRWIKEFECARDDNMQFDEDPKDKEVGIASINGNMTANQSVNFVIYAVDVTKRLLTDPYSTDLLSAIVDGKDVPEAVILEGVPGPL